MQVSLHPPIRQFRKLHNPFEILKHKRYFHLDIFFAIEKERSILVQLMSETFWEIIDKSLLVKEKRRAALFHFLRFLFHFISSPINFMDIILS